MPTFWLISSIALWVVVIILSVLVVGLLQQLGLIQRRLDAGAADQENSDLEEPAKGTPGQLPSLSKDGPNIGSSIPELTLETCNHDKAPLTPASWHHQNGTLVLFLSAVCESCQHLTEALNRLVDQRVFEGRVIVILRADRAMGQGFLKLFPLHAPVVLDNESKVSMGFEVHRMPMALLYDAQGKLLRKGTPITYEGLLVLIAGDLTRAPELSPEERERIYPSLVTEQTLA